MKNTTLAIVVMAIAVFAFLNMAKKRQAQQQQAKIRTSAPVENANPEPVDQDEPDEEVVQETVEQKTEPTKVSSSSNETTTAPAPIPPKQDLKEGEFVDTTPPEKGIFCGEHNSEIEAFYLNGKGNFIYWEDAKASPHFNMWVNAEGKQSSFSGAEPTAQGTYVNQGNKFILYRFVNSKKETLFSIKAKEFVGREIIEFEDGDGTLYFQDICRRRFSNLEARRF